MISLNKINLSKKDLGTKTDPISKLLEKIHKHNQGFYTEIDNKKPLKKITEFAKKNKNKFKHIVVLGIGGSTLGTIATKTAFPPTKDLFIIDNIDPSLIEKVENQIDLKKTLFIVISKSGTTTETLSLFYYFKDKCRKNQIAISKNFVIITGITGPSANPLRETAKKEKIETFDIPENICGRFSIFTPVTLLPAALAEININKILSGAKKMRDKFLSTKKTENLPFQLAKIQHTLHKKKKTINVIMPYSQKLTGITDWYRQLLAESIGKKNKGITPVKALGATDQHSQLQLYTEGPNDKLIIFIESEKLKPKLKIPSTKLTFEKLLKIEKSATEKSLTNKSRPNITITLDSISERSFGEMAMLMMGSIAFLGEFFKINAFNQPGVEESKKIIKNNFK